MGSFDEVLTIVKNEFSISNFLIDENKHEIIAEIYKGLTEKQKHISSRFFYNDNGSILFEKITELPEYYLTRTEKTILKTIAPEIIREDEPLDIIELGSGDCSKISILLDAVFNHILNHTLYIPVDVSEAAITKSANHLTEKYPGLRIHGLLADFMKHLTAFPGERRRLICFFGSTIGNLTRQQTVNLLIEIKLLMKPGDQFLLGLDMVKDINLIELAYNDNQGLTALFNKNILHVINDYAQTNFDTKLFEHRAFYNEEDARIEMHLMAKEDMVIKNDLFPEKIFISKGETIHTENSHKFTSTDIEYFASVTGLKIEKIYTDKNQWFSLVLFKCNE